MALNEQVYQNYVQILKEELIPALGCTEPIAIAYAAAKARETLGALPDRMTVACSGNIIKNVKGVVVPTTKTLKGMAAAAIIGVIGGKAELELEVLSQVTPAHLEQAKVLLEQKICTEELLKTPAKLHIIVRLWHGEESAMVEIIHTHTGIVRIEKNGEVLLDVPHQLTETSSGTDRSCLNIADIFAFANTVRVEDVKIILDRQIKYNCAISEEGLANSYGASVGKTLMEAYDQEDVKICAQAAAAAGSDARMSGCEMPVVINSGSGNQGITASMPVIVYAKKLEKTDEELYRALCLSNLTAIHQKTKIGRLSAYCGVVSAATGAGAGIMYLYGGDLADISQVITTSLADVSGIVCDGAKPSCAAKIASSVNATLLAVYMTKRSRGFAAGEGLVKNTVEKTIDNISHLAKDGMETTDEVILNLMVAAE